MAIYYAHTWTGRKRKILHVDQVTKFAQFKRSITNNLHIYNGRLYINIKHSNIIRIISVSLTILGVITSLEFVLVGVFLALIDIYFDFHHSYISIKEETLSMVPKKLTDNILNIGMLLDVSQTGVNPYLQPNISRSLRTTAPLKPRLDMTLFMDNDLKSSLMEYIKSLQKGHISILYNTDEHITIFMICEKAKLGTAPVYLEDGVLYRKYNPFSYMVLVDDEPNCIDPIIDQGNGCHLFIEGYAIDYDIIDIDHLDKKSIEYYYTYGAGLHRKIFFPTE